MVLSRRLYEDNIIYILYYILIVIATLILRRFSFARLYLAGLLRFTARLGWIPGFFEFSTLEDETWIWKAQIEDHQNFILRVRNWINSWRRRSKSEWSIVQSMKDLWIPTRIPNLLIIWNWVIFLQFGVYRSLPPELGSHHLDWASRTTNNKKIFDQLGQIGNKYYFFNLFWVRFLYYFKCSYYPVRRCFETEFIQEDNLPKAPPLGIVVTTEPNCMWHSLKETVVNFVSW